MRARSLRNRLAFLFFAVTAFALAVVIFVFLPQLDTKIQDQKLGDLRAAAVREAPRLQRVIGQPVTGRKVDDVVRGMSDDSGARVTLLGIQQSSKETRPRFYVISDSNQTTPVAPNDALAARAISGPRTAPPASAIVAHRGEVAVPIWSAGAPGWVAIFGRDFGDA